MRFVRRSIAVAVAVVIALAIPAAAQATDFATFSQVDSADPVNPGDLVTYTVTVRTDGSSAGEPVVVALSQNKRDLPHVDLGEPPNNPYRSVKSSRGTCAVHNTSTDKYAECNLGALSTSATTKITAVVEMNESMDQYVSLLSNGSYTDSIEPTTVSVPPALDGSKKIGLKGLPAGCASDDFKLKAKAKGKHPKKITASLEGKKLKAKKGKRLKATVPVADLAQSSLNELTVKATFFGSPQQKTVATFQRC